MPPKRKSDSSKKRAQPSKKKSSTTLPSSPSTLELPREMADHVQVFVENFDFALHKDHLDSLGQHIREELHVFLDDDEEAYLAAADENDIADRINHVVGLAWHRRQKAEHAFRLLDQAGKGVVVFEDLRCVANDLLDAKVTDEDLEEMIREIDKSDDGILTKEDFYRLANQINL